MGTAAAALGAGAAAAQGTPDYTAAARALAERYGAKFSGKAQVRAMDGGGNRGVVAAQAFKEGEAILRVPLERCIVLDVEGMAYEEWPPWFALELLRHRAGEAFWGEYCGALMPTAAEAAAQIPVAAPGGWLERHGAVPIVQRLIAMRAAAERAVRGLTGGSRMPEGLEWAMAMVLSRCFGLDAHNSRIALVPWLDLFNHGPSPNAALTVDPHRNTVFVFASRDVRALSVLEYKRMEPCLSRGGGESLPRPPPVAKTGHKSSSENSATG